MQENAVCKMATILSRPFCADTKAKGYCIFDEKPS